MSDRSPVRPSRPSISACFAALARFVVRFRWLVVALVIVVLAAVSRAFPSLGSEINNNNSAFLPASAPSTKAAKLAAPLLGTQGRSAAVLIIATDPAGLSPADYAAIGRELALVRTVPRVQAVRLLGISRDRQAAQLRARISLNGFDVRSAKPVVGDLQDTFTRVGAPPGLRLHLAGQLATLVANQASSDRSGHQLQLFSILFIVVLLLVVFRAPLAAVVTLAPSALALAISFRLIGELGAHGVKISDVTQVLLIVLLLGAGTDYGLFLVFRVREELGDGRSPHDAVRHSLQRVGESISASAATVILALLTLLAASFGFYHDLAVLLAVGMAVMLALGLTVLPALLALFGRAAFWPARIAPGAQREGAWGRVAARLVARPAWTLGVGVAAFLALAAGALGYRSSGFGGVTSAPPGSDAAAGNAALARHFPETSTNPANLVFAFARPVWRDPGVIAAARASLAGSGQFSSLSGPLDATGVALAPQQYARLHARLGPPSRLPLVEPPALGVPTAAYNAYRASAEFVSPTGTVVQFEAALRAGPQQSTAAMDATPTIRAAVARAGRAAGAERAGVAGQAAASYDISTTANHDLALIIPIAVVAIGLVLAVVLRSLVAPLYLIVSVVLSYLAALGVATIVFIDLAGQAGISFFLPFLMFVFLLALGEDYNILVMTRIREEARALTLRQAVVKAIARTGTTVTSAGIILGGTFGVLAATASGTDASQLRAIGVGLAVGILMDTFLVRTLLVPATVTLLGRRNWWPSAMARAGGRDYAEMPRRPSSTEAADTPTASATGA
jgi:RND superfamily putative drug exporter